MAEATLPPIGAEVPAPPQSAQPTLPPVGSEVPEHLTATFRSSNAKDADGHAEVDPNTLGTFVKHLWDGVNPVAIGQLLPWPKALGGSGTDNPLNPQKVVDALHAVKIEADAALKNKDYVGAFAKYMESVVPILGPMMAHQGNELQQGKYAAAAGDMTALAATAATGKLQSDAIASRFPLTTHPVATAPAVAPAVVDFAQAHSIPLDAATVSDNLAVKGTQAIADRSLGGSLVATPARAAQAEAMTRVGGELADAGHPVSMTPEQAGTSLRDALTAKVRTHAQEANTAYDTMRELEQTPTKNSVGGTRSETTVQLAGAKAALRPLYEQMTRQMPITQQQANAGIKALENVLTGPDTAPLSQVDRDLSAIKSVARERGGLAKFAVKKLEGAVQDAAEAGGADVVKALKDGRAATVAKYAASDVLDALHAEPVRIVKTLTAPKDSAIQSLRTVLDQVPDQAPVIARGYLEDLLEKPQRVAEWRKLGARTKDLLFPDGQADALDSFFTLTKRISDTNVNPSGSGYVAALGAQGAMLWYDPVRAIPMQLGAAALSKILRSPVAIKALTRGLSLPVSAPLAARTAATANFVRAATDAGVPLTLPKAADREESR